jgi:hypothetical protein
MDCRRDASDPLLKELYHQRKLHLVEPRVGFAVGEVLIQKPGGDIWPATLADLFAETPNELVLGTGEPCADVENKVSGKFKASTMVGFLQGIAAAFGVEGSAKLAAAYGEAKTLRLRVRGVRADRINLAKAARFLVGATLRQDQGLYRDGDRLYLIREVLRAEAVQVAAQDASDLALNVSAESTGLLAAHLALSAHNDFASDVVYQAKTAAAFALRLVEITPEPPGWGVVEITHPVVVRGREAQPDAPDAIIGDAEQGPLFLALGVRPRV